MTPGISSLPLIISVPHGGLEVPPEVEKYCRLDSSDLLREGDIWADFIYNIKEHVHAFIKFPVARAIIDVNRAADDRPPQNPDGVVKTLTLNNDYIWEKVGGLSEDQIGKLLDRYYYPYHQYLSAYSVNRDILLGLDCHTMLERAPQISNCPGEARPLVCLSNGGDENGEALDEPVTASPDLIRSLAQALERQLMNFGLDSSVPPVLLNRPFSGGYITKTNGSVEQIPWIQIEFNRSLYLSDEPRVSGPDQQTTKRIEMLKMYFLKALEDLFL